MEIVHTFIQNQAELYEIRETFILLMNYEILLMNWEKLQRFQESVLLKNNETSKVYTVVGFIIFTFLLIFVIDIT